MKSKVFSRSKGSNEFKVLKSKEFQGGKDVEEQSVPGRKVCRGAKGSRKKNVLRSKGF